MLHYPKILARSPVLCNPESVVRDFKLIRTTVFLITESGAIDPGIRSPDSLNAESGAIDPGIRSPDSLNAESGSGGVSRGLGVTLSATIRSRPNRDTPVRTPPRYGWEGLGGQGRGCEWLAGLVWEVWGWVANG